MKTVGMLCVSQDRAHSLQSLIRSNETLASHVAQAYHALLKTRDELAQQDHELGQLAEQVSELRAAPAPAALLRSYH